VPKSPKSPKIVQSHFPSNEDAAQTRINIAPYQN
jgi:hypothetical protein